MDYLNELPASIPPEQRLVHNHMEPTHRLGSEGFCAWLEPAGASDDRLEPCECGWASKLGPHFRVRDPVQG